MNPTIVGSNAWAAAPWANLVDRAPWIVAYGALLLAKPFVVAIIPTALLPPAGYAVAEAVSTRARRGPGERDTPDPRLRGPHRHPRNHQPAGASSSTPGFCGHTEGDILKLTGETLLQL